MIDFELSDKVQEQKNLIRSVAEGAMRPIAREFDEREHEKPWDFLKMMWDVSGGRSMTGEDSTEDPAAAGRRRARHARDRLSRCTDSRHSDPRSRRRRTGGPGGAGR